MTLLYNEAADRLQLKDMDSEKCQHCKGKGKYNCFSCDGKGKKEVPAMCRPCNGTGEQRYGECAICCGAGSHPYTEEVDCKSCDGDGEKTCDKCYGSGDA